MKIEVDLNKNYLILFGIIFVFALTGGVLAAVGHPASQIDWRGSIPANITVGESLVAQRWVAAAGGFCIGTNCITNWNQAGGGGTGGTSQWSNAGADKINYNGDVGIGYANPEDRTGDGDLSVGGKAIVNQGILTSIISVSPETNEDYMNINTNSILVNVNGNVNARKYCINGTNCIDTWPSGTTTTTPGTTTTPPAATIPGWISTGGVNVPGTDYVRAKEFTVNFRGWVVINSTLKVDVTGNAVTAYSKVCKNLDTTPITIASFITLMTSCGPEHSTTSTDYQYYKDAIAVSPGDKVQLYVRSSHAGVYTASTNLLKTETIYSTPGAVIGGGTLNSFNSYPFRICTPWGEASCTGSLTSLSISCPASISTARVTGVDTATTTTTYYICVEN